MENKVKWSQAVTQNSHALDLEKGVFTWQDPKEIARSLLRSAKNSTRRKGSVYQSAMSMLNFYINRAGKKLPIQQKLILNTAKEELRNLAKQHSFDRSGKPSHDL